MNIKVLCSLMLLMLPEFVCGAEAKIIKTIVRKKDPNETVNHKARTRLSSIENEDVEIGGVVFASPKPNHPGYFDFSYASNDVVKDLEELQGQQIVLETQLKTSQNIFTYNVDPCDAARVIHLNKLSQEWQKEKNVPRIIGQKEGGSTSKPDFSINAVGDNIPVEKKPKYTIVKTSFMFDGWFKAGLRINQLMLPLSVKVLKMLHKTPIHPEDNGDIIVKISQAGQDKYLSLSIKDAQAIARNIAYRFLLAGSLPIAALLAVYCYYFKK